MDYFNDKFMMFRDSRRIANAGNLSRRKSDINTYLQNVLGDSTYFMQPADDKKTETVSEKTVFAVNSTVSKEKVSIPRPDLAQEYEESDTLSEEESDELTKLFSSLLS